MMSSVLTAIATWCMSLYPQVAVDGMRSQRIKCMRDISICVNGKTDKELGKCFGNSLQP